MKVVIVISGRGSNMAALLDRDISAAAVLSNSPRAPGLAHARSRGIECIVEDTVLGICDAIEKLSPDLVCLAGFMRLLPERTTKKFNIMNIHPSLLPYFPGLRAQEQALHAGVKYSGCTVHMVDGGVDTGRIILQKSVQVRHNDTVESLSGRILEREHEAYAQAVKMFMGYGTETQTVSRFCEQFEDRDDAIEFALKRWQTPSSPTSYMWMNGDNTMISKDPPESVPHVAITPDDNLDVIRHRLDNMVDWGLLKIHDGKIPAV